MFSISCMVENVKLCFIFYANESLCSLCLCDDFKYRLILKCRASS